MLPSALGIVGVAFTEEAGRTIAFAVLGIGYPFGAALGLFAGDGP